LEQLDWFQPFGDLFLPNQNLSFLQTKILGLKK
jgi:hypothetical protein